MRTTISPLPADLGTLRGPKVRSAIDDRKARLKEIFADADVNDYSNVSAADVAEAQRLNDEIERLEDFAGATQPHPGFPVPASQRRNRSRGGYGRMEGLGAEFLRQLSRQNHGGLMAALDGTTGGATLPDSWFDPQIHDLPQRRLFVRSLIPTSRVDSDKVAYIKQTVFTNNAAAVAASALKPTTVLTVAREEALIQTIAHVSEALDRSLLADHDQLTGFIDQQLRLGVLLEEERQILAGDGTPPNISGILDQAGIQTQAKGADPTPDAIQKAITKVRLVFGEPDAVALHPNDWQEIALLRTSDGEYIWSHPAAEAEPSIWGLPVIVSPVMTEGTALVGAFGVGAEVYEREGARVTFTESGLGDSAGEELFTRNQIRFRGESRIGLAVFRPDFFCSITGI